MGLFTDMATPASKPSRTPLERLLHVILFISAIFYGYTLYSAWSWTGTLRPAPVEKAVVVLSGPSNVSGVVTFYQEQGRGPVTVSVDIQNLDPNSLRGFHVHQSGDLSQGCLSAGPHFNPFGATHGSPTDDKRHVRDLGNILSNVDGSVIASFQDAELSLNGPSSILGRAVVVHAGTDDLGKGGDEESLKTGNAGARAACGVIGIAA